MATPEHVDALVDDFLHGLLDTGAGARVERHCDECTACAAALAGARRRHDALRDLPTETAAEPLIQATLGRITADRERRPRRRRRVTILVGGALAASALILAALHVHYARLAPTPYDLTVLGERELLAATPAALRVRLVDRDANQALAGVPVRVELRGLRGPKQGTMVELASFTTDRHGSGNPRFNLPDWADGDYELCVTAQTPGGLERLTQPVRLKRSWKLMLSSDKPVYQPGQTIRLRAPALRRPDLRPVGAEAATFTVTDPHGNVIFKKRGPTSRFGITAADCPLAHEILEGGYTVACKVGDSDSRLTVEVKKYELPKYKVDVEFDRPFYGPGESARLTVKAGYFFGKPVAGAAVEVEVRPEHAGAKVLHRLTGRTDATGAAELTAMLPQQLGADPVRVVFDVRITDSAGQKAMRTAQRVVTSRPVRVDVLPEGGRLVRGVPNQIYVLLTRADGQPQPGRVAIAGLGEWATDDFGLAVFSLTPQSAGATLAVRASDRRGTLLDERNVNLSAGGNALDFLLTTDRAVYHGGDTLRLTALGAETEPVFVDFIKDGQTLLSETVEMAGGRGAHTLDLPPELAGTIELRGYRIDRNNGMPATRRHVLYVVPRDDLKLTAKLRRAEYRPGERARLNLTLTDASGQPSPGALSLAAVDEAVFAVLERAPGMERTFYNLELETLQPVFALSPWSPITKGSPERARFEKALFAAATRVVGTVTEINNSAPSHSLAVATFPAKRQAATKQQTQGLGWVALGWILLVFATFNCGMVALWRLFGAGWAMGSLQLCWGVIGCALAVLLISGEAGSFSRNNLRHFRLGVDAIDGSALWDPDVALTPGAINVNAVYSLALRRDLSDSLGRFDDTIRIRELFPETLLWRPEIITDDAGQASLDIDLADSITTWRLTGSAVAVDGRLGAVETSIKVFQPFFVDLNLPAALSRGDEVAVPVVVSNYLERPQRVTLTLAGSNWFEHAGAAEQQLDLGAREVRAVHYRLRAKMAGTHELQVTARAGTIADAIKRTVEVLPDGRRVEQVVNGMLRQPADVPLTVPADAIPGSVKAVVKIYPSGFSQLVEGLDGIFRLPSGCFEQASSTTYPNVLALDYLRRTGRSAPTVEAKARQFIHLGYQRLVGFEVPGGGFDWFGRAPANRVLTAYGLMEFVDMARVHDVDPRLIERTRRWLMDQRRGDGSWEPEGHGLAGDADHGSDGRLAATAYIAWAVFGEGQSDRDTAKTLDYLRGHSADAIGDPYVLALVANALLALDPSAGAAGPYLDRLHALHQADAKTGHAWWEQAAAGQTLFHGAGRGGSVETTALAALALLHGDRHPETARAALAWLASRRDAGGTWHSTQATVLALKALVAGSTPDTSGKERRILVQLDGQPIEAVVISSDQAEVMRQIELTKQLSAGDHHLTLEEPGGTAAAYQVAMRYHVPGAAPAGKPEPLAIELTYDRTELAVGESLQATARVVNRLPAAAAMVMVELPVAAGFVPVAEEFAALVDAGTIARYQVEPRRVLLYLRDLPSGKPLSIVYRLRATLAGQTAGGRARVYQYYNPDVQGQSGAVRFIVKARE